MEILQGNFSGKTVILSAICFSTVSTRPLSPVWQGFEISCTYTLRKYIRLPPGSPCPRRSLPALREPLRLRWSDTLKSWKKKGSWTLPENRLPYWIRVNCWPTVLWEWGAMYSSKKKAAVLVIFLIITDAAAFFLTFFPHMREKKDRNASMI